MAHAARQPDRRGASQSSDGPVPTPLASTSVPNAETAADVNTPPVSRDGVTYLASASLPTPHGDFQIAVARVVESSEQVVVLTLGDLSGDEPLLVRVHSECLTGEVLGSLRCDCGAQLTSALAAIAEAGRGALIYLYQEGRGIGLVNKIRAYALQDHGMDTVEANLALGLPVDRRDYRGAAAILRSRGILRVRLLTNNPAKCQGLERYDIHVIERIPLVVSGTPNNLAYLRTKVERMGHVFDLDAPSTEPNRQNRSPAP